MKNYILFHQINKISLLKKPCFYSCKDLGNIASLWSYFYTILFISICYFIILTHNQQRKTPVKTKKGHVMFIY